MSALSLLQSKLDSKQGYFIFLINLSFSDLIRKNPPVPPISQMNPKKGVQVRAMFEFEGSGFSDYFFILTY